MESFKINPMIATDSYKLGHKSMYPEGTTMVYSNMTPRSGKILKRIVPASVYDDKFVFFGLQGLIKHYMGLWKENFFDKPLSEAVYHFTNTVLPFIGATRLDVEGVVSLHKLGYLPLEIKSLSEGSVIPFKIPVFTVKNTLPEFYWLTNYTETYFSNEFWKPSTTATIARYYRKLLEKYAVETGCPLEFVDFQAHDFSCRGMSGMYDSATSGAGHLVYFKGSDTLVATDFIKYAYKPVNDQELIGCSVPATEHSVMTSEGLDGEFKLFKRIITEVVPNGIVSLVSDSFDFWKVITEYTVELKQEILDRGEDPITGLSKTVFRPDSGDPVKIVCGDPDGKTEAERKGAIECLWDVFGGEVNSQGYKVLHSKVGLIYGDSITLERCEAILQGLKRKGFCTSCIVFGVGSFTYQYLTRDTCGLAVKATYREECDKGFNIFKDPKTDDGTKKSAKGLLMVVEEGFDYKLIDEVTPSQEKVSDLEVVFYNGTLFKNQSIDRIRQRVKDES